MHLYDILTTYAHVTQTICTEMFVLQFLAALMIVYALKYLLQCTFNDNFMTNRAISYNLIHTVILTPKQCSI